MKSIEYCFKGTEFIYRVPDRLHFEQLVKCFSEMYGISEDASKLIITEWLKKKEVEAQFEEEIKEHFKSDAYEEFLWRN